MEIIETYAIEDRTSPGRDLGLLRITTKADGGPHLATKIEVVSLDLAGLADGTHSLAFLKTEMIDPTQPRRFRHLRVINDQGGPA